MDELLKKLTDFGLSEIMSVHIPDAELTNVEYVRVKGTADLTKIPKVSGVYWIATDEIVPHAMHTHRLPEMFDDFEIVYNGVADNLRGRAKDHLARERSRGMSGISVDILMHETADDHTKCCYDPRQRSKVPYIDGEKMTHAAMIKMLQDRQEELKFAVKQTGPVHFKNGINTGDRSRADCHWRFYYMPITQGALRMCVETRWRERYGHPRLCSYLLGR